MGAYNYISFTAKCPKCNTSSCIKAQCHVASSYNGDQSGRFHAREYKIGDRMAWWETENENYDSWSDEGHMGDGDRLKITECCYAKCENSHNLYAIILFEDLVIKAVLEVGPEEKWPNNYPQ